MRRLALFGVLLLVAGTASAASDRRTLTLEHGTEGIQTVTIEAGVGDVEVAATDAGKISVEVRITPKHGGFFGSARAQSVIENLSLRADVKGSSLVLKLEGADRHEHDFGEDWTVEVPATIGASIKLGVGDVRIVDLASDIDVEAGVGDVKVEGAYTSFGRIHASSGVGDAELRTPEGRREAEGFIGHSLSADGPGKAEIQLKIGVGDSTIRLR